MQSVLPLLHQFTFPHSLQRMASVLQAEAFQRSMRGLAEDACFGCRTLPSCKRQGMLTGVSTWHATCRSASSTSRSLGSVRSRRHIDLGSQTHSSNV